jgi:beta-galactosidase
VRGPRQEYELTLPGLADRAHVSADGRLLGVVDRDAPISLPLAVPAEGLDLEVLVESMGRVNYGPWLGEHKGLVEGVRHGGQHLFGWTTAALPLSAQPALPATVDATGVAAPAFFRGTFEAAAPADAFLDTTGWGKGYVWVNGFALGRYWDRGPQRTLYCPAPVIRAGANEVVVLELDARPEEPVLALVDDLDLGPTATQPGVG